MKYARFCLFIYGTAVLAIIARVAFADGNACPTSVTGGRNAQAQVTCTPDDCETTGFCEPVVEEDWAGVTFWMYFPGTGWRAYGGGAGDIEYCACIAWAGDPPEWYIENEAVSNVCCRAVAFRPETGGSWVGTIGYCGGGCPAGECEIEEDAAGAVTGVCQ